MSETLPRKPAPARHGRRASQVIGRLKADRFPIFCHERVLDEILDYSALDRRCERGGFLLGGAYRDARPYVEVQEFVPAVRTIGNAGSMRFTHETWSQAHREIATCHPGLRIVGWQHTHPGLGVFFSSYDRFIHENFFAEPWHIAMVVDPRQCEFGFYQWDGDRLVDTGFVLVPDETA